MRLERTENVLLTVGTNPLPVLVATWRIASHLKPQRLFLLHSSQTEPMALAVMDQLRRRWSEEGIEPILIKPAPVGNAASPKAIADTVYQLVSKHPSGWHLHYTGGTKTMVLKAMQALGAKVITDSYLDVNHHAVLDQTGCYLDRETHDERRCWNLELRDLCKLHGLTMDFRLEHRYTTKDNARTECGACFGRAKAKEGDTAYPLNGESLETEWEGIGADTFHLLAGFGEIYKKEIGAFRKSFEKNWNDPWPILPRANVTTSFHWPSLLGLDAHNSREWMALPGRINKVLTGIRWDAVDGLQKVEAGPSSDLARIMHLVNGGDLELAAHKHLREALEGRKLKFSIRHSTHIAHQPPEERQAVRHCFELDVVAILGYQVVVVSCVRENKEGSRSSVKNKAFEALHRARQVGGDGARAIVICGLDGDAAEDLEEELHDETGLTGEAPDKQSASALKPLRIWPKESWTRLRESFEDYLTQDLNWRI